MAVPIVAVDPLYADPAEAEQVVELAHRWGRYRLYGDQERLSLDLGRGLLPRHDSVQHFLRSGGSRGLDADLKTLAARTSYFREEYAYGTDERIGGIGSFLHHPRLIEAAQAVHDRPVIEPAIAFANLMVPGQELAVHTDVPEFRGANRKVIPQWLLVVMHHAGLFERWRLPIATGIAYFQDAAHGELRYWPDGPEAEPTIRPVEANTAIVLDTDTVFHGVDPVAPGVEAPPIEAGAGLTADDAGRWILTAPDGTEIGSYDWDDLRFSVSWKAYCFADDAERDAWRTGSDDLTTEQIVDTLVADLIDREIVPADVAVDRDLGLLLIDEHVHYPGATSFA